LADQQYRQLNAQYETEAGKGREDLQWSVISPAANPNDLDWGWNRHPKKSTQMGISRLISEDFAPHIPKWFRHGWCNHPHLFLVEYLFLHPHLFVSQNTHHSLSYPNSLRYATMHIARIDGHKILATHIRLVCISWAHILQSSERSPMILDGKVRSPCSMANSSYFSICPSWRLKGPEYHREVSMCIGQTAPHATPQLLVHSIFLHKWWNCVLFLCFSDCSMWNHTDLSLASHAAGFLELDQGKDCRETLP
jgi:hypothetical protein